MQLGDLAAFIQYEYLYCNKDVCTQHKCLHYSGDPFIIAEKTREQLMLTHVAAFQFTIIIPTWIRNSLQVAT